MLSKLRTTVSAKFCKSNAEIRTKILCSHATGKHRTVREQKCRNLILLLRTRSANQKSSFALTSATELDGDWRRSLSSVGKTENKITDLKPSKGFWFS